jgi:hypothetical protein
LVYCIEKNLATLVRNRLYCGKNIDIGPAEEQKVRREGGRPDQKKKGKKINEKRSRPGVDVMITIFCDFSQFSAKKLAFFLKTNVIIKYFSKFGPLV